MLTHPTITTSSVADDTWRQNVAIDIRWPLVLVTEEIAGHHQWVSVFEGQHKSNSHLHEKLHLQALLIRSLIGCFVTYRLVGHIRYKDISYGICCMQCGIGARLSVSSSVGARLYHVTIILYH